MNKRVNRIFALMILPSMLVFVACTSTNRATDIPKYVHYASAKVGMEFDYPAVWLFDERKIPETNIIVISLKDPRFKTIPVAWQVDPHPFPNDYGVVDIWVSPRALHQTADLELEIIKASYSRISWIKILGSYTIKVDGCDASVLEYQTYPTETEGGVPSIMFSRRIFIIANNQLYKLYFTVAEKERGGEFEQGYEYFFNSLRIIP